MDRQASAGCVMTSQGAVAHLLVRRRNFEPDWRHESAGAEVWHADRIAADEGRPSPPPWKRPHVRGDVASRADPRAAHERFPLAILPVGPAIQRAIELTLTCDPSPKEQPTALRGVAVTAIVALELPVPKPDAKGSRAEARVARATDGVHGRRREHQRHQECRGSSHEASRILETRACSTPGGIRSPRHRSMATAAPQLAQQSAGEAGAQLGAVVGASCRRRTPSAVPTPRHVR